MAPLLVADSITKRFGGLVAVSKLDFTLEQGVIASVIGPNGAGKTTFFNCIAGFYRIDEGSIHFDGVPVHEMRRDLIAHLGIARTYQNIRLFAKMTAMENLLVGQHQNLRSSWIGAVVGTK
jgi:branched-chain amino acid transport system ATP-binding protein